METFIRTFNMPESVCDDLIDYYHEKDEYKFEGVSGDGINVNKDVKDSIDVNFFNSSTDPRIKRYFSELQKGFDVYIKEFNISYIPLKTFETNMIQYYPPGGGFKEWHFERNSGTHRDNRQLVYMTYLNDVPNGGTEWYYQNIKLEAKKGLSVIWPADFAWVHRGIVSKTHEKYIATGWFIYSYNGIIRGGAY